jgi:hypothetical protein
MSITNIDIGVVLNDKKSLVILCFIGELMIEVSWSWSIAPIDNEIMPFGEMRWWTYPKFVLQHACVMMFTLQYKKVF